MGRFLRALLLGVEVITPFSVVTFLAFDLYGVDQIRSGPGGEGGLGWQWFAIASFGFFAVLHVTHRVRAYIEVSELRNRRANIAFLMPNAKSALEKSGLGLTYSLTIINHGPAQATGVRLSIISIEPLPVAHTEGILVPELPIVLEEGSQFSEDSTINATDRRRYDCGMWSTSTNNRTKQRENYWLTANTQWIPLAPQTTRMTVRATSANAKSIAITLVFNVNDEGLSVSPQKSVFDTAAPQPTRS